ncbi:MAG: pyruvate formate lyase-activating protein [Clostridia bacterium]|nr:pyruvate formate lyase-activating protein [Clostridia bacterium]
MKGYVHSIESFGTVDGPGVRFVVFFQGCPMRCLYCHNPDTWVTHAGTEYEAQELIDRMVRNLPFYETGGITATGGEPLMQIDFLTELFKLAKARGIHTALDTSGITFNKENQANFDKLMEYCDLIMLDIKHIDKNEHKKLTGFSNESVLNFLEYLEKKEKRVWIRHVIVPDITYKDEYLLRLGGLIKNYGCIDKIDVLPYHTLGVSKYEGLGIEYPLNGVPQLTKSDAQKALEVINSAIHSK